MSETAPPPADPTVAGESRRSPEDQAMHDIPPAGTTDPAVLSIIGGNTLRPQAQDYHDGGRLAAYQLGPTSNQNHRSSAYGPSPMQNDFNGSQMSDAPNTHGGWLQKLTGFGGSKPPHEQMLEGLRQQNARLSWTNAELQNWCSGLQQNLQAKDNELGIWSTNLNKKHRELEKQKSFVDAANSRMIQLKNEHQSAIKAHQLTLHQNHTTELQSRQQQHDRARKALEESYLNKEANLRQTYERELQHVKKQHKEEMQEVQRELRQSHVQELNALEPKIESRLKRKMFQDMEKPAEDPEKLINAALQSEKAKYDTMKHGLDRKVAELITQVREMQAAKMRSVESIRWAALSHSDIERSLNSALSEIRQWAQKHTSTTIEAVIEPKAFERICKHLSDEDCIESPDALRDHLMDDPKMQKPGKAAALLLTAMASSVLIARIITNPFFAFVGNENEKLLHKQEGVTLRRVLSRLQSGDEPAVHATRCQILRFFDPLDAQDANAARLKEIAIRSRTAAGKKYANIVTSGIAHLFMGKDKMESARPELEGIANKLVELSWQLWTRKPLVEVWKMTNLGCGVDKKKPLVYISTDDRLQLHALHNGDVEDQKDALDGREVILTSSPAVVAFGNADGENYEKCNVLRKAVVWLGASSSTSAPKKAEDKVEPGGSRVYQHHKGAVLGKKDTTC